MDKILKTVTSLFTYGIIAYMFIYIPIMGNVKQDEQNGTVPPGTLPPVISTPMYVDPANFTCLVDGQESACEVSGDMGEGHGD